jgi:hypothetical protein
MHKRSIARFAIGHVWNPLDKLGHSFLKMERHWANVLVSHRTNSCSVSVSLRSNHVPLNGRSPVTNAGNNQSFSIQNGFLNHFAHQHAFGHNHHQRGFGHPAHGRGGFGHPAHGHGGFGHQPFGGSPFGHSAMPKIFYLFTSPEESFEPYWAPQPMLLPPGADRPHLGNGVTYRISWNHGYIYYIMGYSEDFL